MPHNSDATRSHPALAALLTTQFYAPAEIIVIDLDVDRIQVARRFGATQTINSADRKAAEKIRAITSGQGVDTAIEAVGIPTTFQICQDIVAPGGVIASVGVHGVKADLHLAASVVPEYHDHNAAGRHRDHSNAAQDGAIEETRSDAIDHASLSARSNHRGL